MLKSAFYIFKNTLDLQTYQLMKNLSLLYYVFFIKHNVNHFGYSSVSLTLFLLNNVIYTKGKIITYDYTMASFYQKHKLPHYDIIAL